MVTLECMCFLPRPTLYVGKYSTSLYASPSMVHEGVAVVVSPLWVAGSQHSLLIISVLGGMMESCVNTP